MLDPATFLTELYVMVDDFCKTSLPAEELRPGPPASLARSEVITLACFGQWRRFRSERDFYRYACRELGRAFPGLPTRSQFNRLLRRHTAAIQALAVHLAECQGARHAPYEAMDCTAVATRNPKRRGHGWLAGMAAIGYSNRLGWFEGLRLLTSVTPIGLITGYAFASGNVNDRPIADNFLEARCYPHPRLPMVGQPASGPYVVDKGFDGRAVRQRWQTDFGVQIIGLPQDPAASAAWPKALRRQIARWRQIVETVNERLLSWFRLESERPHALCGFHARLAAKVALHNFVIWINRSFGRPPLACADLISW